jgi:hypothetical protein
MRGTDGGFRRRSQAIQIQGSGLPGLHVQTSRCMLCCLILPAPDNDAICCVDATKNLRLEAGRVKVSQEHHRLVQWRSAYLVRVKHDKVSSIPAK